MIRFPQTNNSHRGFTLVELLIAMAISSIVLAAIYSIFVSSQKLNTSNEVTAKIMQNLRLSLDMMESDIQMAGLQGLIAVPGVGIVEATATKLRLAADRNMDGTLNTLNPAHLMGGLQETDFEQITYYYDAATQRLKQCLSEGTPNASCATLTANPDDANTVAYHVTNFSFTYVDASNNIIANPAANLTAIRSVKVTMTISQPAGMAGIISRTMTRQIFCRNLAMQ
jgi:prepilin-type N-terminal cleavage/methylation domain-containing protein